MSAANRDFGWCFFLAVCVLCGTASKEISAGERGPSPSGLYQLLKQATVEVLVDRRLSGSGCVVDAGGLVLTAAHVVSRPEARIEILTATAGRQAAKLMAIDAGHDLALLRLPMRKEGYPSLALAEKMPGAGQTVYLFGAPLFRHHVLIRGEVARDGNTFEFTAGHYVEVVHICGLSPKGVSGGPWVDRQGRVFGVQSSMMSLGDALQGIAFAAPLEAVRTLVAKKQSASTPSIGSAVEEIWEQPPGFLAALDEGVRGVVAKVVKPEGPAAAAGIGNGAVITSVDGHAAEYRDDFVRAIRRKKAGEEVKLVVADSHGRNAKQVSVRLASLEGPLTSP